MAFAGAAMVGVQSNARPVANAASSMKNNNTVLSLADEEEMRRVEEEGEGHVAVRTRGTYEEKKETRGKIKRKPWYIIDPRTSKFMGYWDAISMVSYAPAIETASQQPELASCARHCGFSSRGVAIERFPPCRLNRQR